MDHCESYRLGFGLLLRGCVFEGRIFPRVKILDVFKFLELRQLVLEVMLLLLHPLQLFLHPVELSPESFVIRLHLTFRILLHLLEDLFRERARILLLKFLLFWCNCRLEHLGLYLRLSGSLRLPGVVDEHAL